MKAMMKNKRAILTGLLLLILAETAVFLIHSNQEGFTGIRIKNPDAYLLDIRQMNGTDQHTLALQKGDSLRVYFKTGKGTLHMEITAPDGTVIYCGNGTETTDFTVNIPQSGVYTITVAARHAKGTIHIQHE